MPLTLEKLRQRLSLIEQAVWRQILPLDGTHYLSQSPLPVGKPEHVRDAAWQPIQRGETWGGLLQTVWLRQPLTLPPALRDQPVALHLRWRSDANQWSSDTIESQIFLGDQLFAGLDAEHRIVLLPRLEQPTELFVQAHVSRTQPFGGLELVVLDEPTWQLTHTMRVALQTIEQIDVNSLAYSQMLHRLNTAINLLDLREAPATWVGSTGPAISHEASAPAFYESVRAANAYLDEQLLEGLDGGTRPKITITGHSHIDVAWLWPLWRTHQKTAHTFATALRLMELYPEYHFTASTPQLYEFAKQDYPELYAQIKQRIAEGRWEPIGAMWLEADCNIPSGESLVRQFLFGMRFFAEEFGLRDRVLWMPDVFGYSAALPQIMRGCGIDTFMTTKISWSQFNRMPFDTFHWRGIDGSAVLTHFVTTPDPANGYYTYNGEVTAKAIAGAWREYRQKPVNDDLLYLMGYGDGGGGPTADQLEMVRRLGDLPNMPEVRYGSAAEYFERLHQRVDNDPRLPTWVGELYLEYHRGTYTSQAWIKQANRRAEQLFHDAEFLAAWAAFGGDTQRELINEGWKLILLNQFHDILPGSSIPEVYEDARQHFAEIMRIGQQVRDTALATLTAGSDAQILAINTLGWQRSDPLFVPQTLAESLGDDARLAVQSIENLDGERGVLVAGFSAASYGLTDLLHAEISPPSSQLMTSTGLLENQFFRIELDNNGEISAIYDKRYDRDVLEPGQTANQLIAYEDRPLNYDAWDIDIFYAEKPYPIQDVTHIHVCENGPIRGGVEITRRFLNSTIRQRILIYSDLPRIDFATEIDWHEHQILLKAGFPVAINATRATYEIQFGAVERPTHRNTSWDVARFETCAHRWIDLSESGYGVALLNDSKYGHDLHMNVLRLTLLKSGVNPDPNADQGLHRFTYSLLPHAGDWREGEVVRRAAELNTPLIAYCPQAAVERQPGQDRASFAHCDAAHVMLDTIKTAEDGDGVIVRVYEAHNQRGPVTLTFAQPIREAEECNLLEEPRTQNLEPNEEQRTENKEQSTETSPSPAATDAEAGGGSGKGPGVRANDLIIAGNTLQFAIRPFEIRSFRVRFGE
ncbi:MAG: alpha-mannosidase [Chloroflexi bacterium]|nr:alpha-mannosidase [Chloroflexota bacterium]